MSLPSALACRVIPETTPTEVLGVRAARAADRAAQEVRAGWKARSAPADRSATRSSSPRRCASSPT